MADAALRYPKLFLSLVKFEHTIFALPFAYIGAFMAVDGVPSASDLVWVTVAMIALAVLYTMAIRSRAGESRAVLRAVATTAIDLICGRAPARKRRRAQ